ncbi:hypothetical protein [Polycladomyces zharkentensis]|nr:hypothetical protein [Polycladomyces sp. WAk]
MLNILSLLLFLGGVFRWVRKEEEDEIVMLLMGFDYAFAMLAD